MAHPQSRGSITTRSSSVGYLSVGAGFDLKSHVWAYKKQREVARKMALFDSEIASEHPAFAAGSPAACGEGYTPEDDALVEEFLRTKIGTTWHPLGTCKMAPLAGKGVVDASLKLHGVKNHGIVYLSIVPGNVAGNTMNLALLVGEKAASIFIHKLGLDDET
ncbi:glucose-methanol-choline oxidoreductase [Xylariomycetidae sp. FL2044]|nr:glucose-methanol-choline oxidoreductase [Xylariomycetidae sp. FL2044]